MKRWWWTDEELMMNWWWTDEDEELLKTTTDCHWLIGSTPLNTQSYLRDGLDGWDGYIPDSTNYKSTASGANKIINMKHTVGKSANLYPSFKDDPWTIRLWQHKLATTCASLGNDCTQQQKRHTHSVRAALAPVYMDCWQQSMCVSIKHNTASRQILCCKKIARIVKLPY